MAELVPEHRLERPRDCGDPAEPQAPRLAIRGHGHSRAGSLRVGKLRFRPGAALPRGNPRLPSRPRESARSRTWAIRRARWACRTYLLGPLGQKESLIS